MVDEYKGKKVREEEGSSPHRGGKGDNKLNSKAVRIERGIEIIPYTLLSLSGHMDRLRNKII